MHFDYLEISVWKAGRPTLQCCGGHMAVRLLVISDMAYSKKEILPKAEMSIIFGCRVLKTSRDKQIGHVITDVMTRNSRDNDEGCCYKRRPTSNRSTDIDRQC